MRDAAASLMRSFIRYWSPFSTFRDASRGDRFERAAAYRENRTRRDQLSGYLFRWLLICGVALALTAELELLASGTEQMRDLLNCAAAGCAVVLSLGVCVVMVTGYVFLYLSQNK